MIQSEDLETQHQKKVNKQNFVTTSLAGKIAFKLFGKGVNANAQATYQHFFYEGIKNILTTARIKSIKQPILQWLKPTGI